MWSFNMFTSLFMCQVTVNTPELMILMTLSSLNDEQHKLVINSQLKPSPYSLETCQIQQPWSLTWVAVLALHKLWDWIYKCDLLINITMFCDTFRQKIYPQDTHRGRRVKEQKAPFIADDQKSKMYWANYKMKTPRKLKSYPKKQRTNGKYV